MNNINWSMMLDQLKNEPVAVLAVVQAGMALAAAFGFHMTPEQRDAILTFSAALFGLLLYVRSLVTPNAVHQAAVEKALNTPVPETTAPPTPQGG